MYLKSMPTVKAQGAYYRPLRYADIDKIEQLELREVDKEELIAGTGKQPKEALLDSIFHSKFTWVLVYDDEIVAVFGISEANNYDGSVFGIPWFLASDRVNKERTKYFLKASKKFVKTILPRYYPSFANFVCSTNTKSIKWLRWLGFTVESDKPIYLKDPEKPFYRFYKRY